MRVTQPFGFAQGRESFDFAQDREPVERQMGVFRQPLQRVHRFPAFGGMGFGRYQLMEPMREKRRLERFILEIPAKIEVMDRAQNPGMLDLLTSNICAGGAYFQTAKSLPEGTEVKVDLILPLDKLEKLKESQKHAYIKVTGRVLRTESRGMAIGFDQNYQIRPWNVD